MTPKQRKIESLIHDVWRQNPRCGTVGTYSLCDCGREASRGIGRCKLCVVEELSKLVGESSTTRYRDAVANIRAMEWEMLNHGKLTQST